MPSNVFFWGVSRLIDSGDPVASDEAAFRVGTLVVRVAERYGHLASGRRGPWARWEDGYLVVDGRWSEPLVVETLRRINGRLAVAKRQPVVDPCTVQRSFGGLLRVRRPSLLVSVRCADEVLLPLMGGAEIIDVKEPLHGSLGMASPETLAACSAAVPEQLLWTLCWW